MIRILFWTENKNTHINKRNSLYSIVPKANGVQGIRMQERRATGGDRGVFPLPFSKGDIGTLLICNINLLFTG